MFFLKSDEYSASYQIQAITINMSSSRNTTSTVPAKTGPYCKVCHDAGRPEKEYTSHYVKDQPGPQGKVICPTLLNQSCRICNKTGHTSSYCPQYRRREEPRREERYIEREPRDYRDDRRREEPRREERYIEREPRRDYRDDRRREEPRREEPRDQRETRDISFNRLRDDTERHEREIRNRDEEYYRKQDRLAKPWLQAALKPAEPQRRDPYAHPHGPRVRLVIEAPALCASKHAAVVDIAAEEVPTAAAAAPPAAAIDIRNVTLNHASKWGDEDNAPFVYDPEKMSREFLQQCIMSGLTTSEEHEFIAACDDQSEMPFFCGQ